MANPNVNRISASIAPADLTAINNGFHSINESLDGYTQALVAEERKKLFGVVQHNKLFDDDTLEEAQLLIAGLPAQVQPMVTKFESDTDLVNQLDKLWYIQLLPLVQRIKDTRRLAAHERHAQALALYKIIRASAKLGLPGFSEAYQKLKKYFANNGRPKVTEV